MKEKIFDVLEKINSPIMVLFNEDIVYFNNNFTESFLGEFYFDKSSISKFKNDWSLHKSENNLHIQANKTKIKYEGSFLTEFLDFQDGVKESYYIYKIQKDFYKYSNQSKYQYKDKKVG